MSDLEHRYHDLTSTPARPSQLRFAEAYIAMARLGYRPAALGDGMGSVHLSEDELSDEDVLTDEAVRYAVKFSGDEDARSFNLGCSNYRTNRAYVFSVEAARLLAGGTDDLAEKLLEAALLEISNNRRKD